MNSQLLFDVAIVPAIVGLTQVAKEIGIDSRFAPGIAIAFGILAALGQMYATQLPWIQAVVLGVTFGLSAAGLYSGVQTLARPSTDTTQTASIPPIPVVKAP